MKNKVMIAALVAIIMALSPLTLADATYDATVQECTDGDFLFEIVKGNAIITEFLDEDAGTVTVPATLGNKGTDCPMKGLGNGSFKESGLTDITLPEGLTNIGKNTFKDCEELVSISFPSTVVKIGENAFYPSALYDDEGNPLDTSADIAEIAGSVFDRAPGQNKSCISEVADMFTVTFDSDGGSDVASLTYATGSAVIAPENPVRDGFSFTGWKPALPETMPAENITVKAVWTAVLPEEFNVTFDIDGGSEIEALSDTPGSILTAPASPTKEGYTFAGWEPALPETMPAENIYVKAVWTINSYTITFDTNGGSAVPAFATEFGSDVPDLSIPQKDGFIFTGWEPVLPETMPSKDLEVKAVWEKTESFMDKELNISIPSLNELREMAYDGVDLLTEKIGMEKLEEEQKDILFIALGLLTGALVIGLIVRRPY